MYNLKALEHLEDQTIKLENENTEINNLKFTIERLQEERKMKADERVKFEKVDNYKIKYFVELHKYHLMSVLQRNNVLTFV